MEFPQLTKLEKLSETLEHRDLSKVVLVAIQHLLASNGKLLEVINSLGLPYDQMFVLGKAYSMNEEVVTELKSRDVYIHPKSSSIEGIGLDVDYKEYLAEAADELLMKALVKLEGLGDSSRLLILDDGGVLIDVASKRLVTDNVVAVEQTRSGAEAIRSLQQINIPVINVAESKLKLMDESPYIAKSIVSEAKNHLSNLPSQPNIEGSVILVVGIGAIGSETARLLKSEAKEVMVYDLNPAATNSSSFAFEDLEAALRRSDFIFGCVGKKWMPNNNKQLIKNGAVLVSGSSSNTEFMGLDLKSTVSIKPKRTFNDNSLNIVHSDYLIELADEGKAWILNGGFPVNFDGSAEPIEPSLIELTRMLMFAGINQALHHKGDSGLVPLDNKVQHIIKKLY